MIISELIEILKQCDQDANIMTHSNNHTANKDESFSIALHNDGRGDSVVIGNFNSFSFDNNPYPAHFHEKILKYYLDSSK